MSSIIEIQKQIRQETADFQEQIAKLTQELSEIKPQEKTEPQRKMNFSRLQRIGAKRAFLNHSLKNIAKDTQHRYLTFLCAVAQMGIYSDDAWIFIQRISSGVEIGSLERCVTDAMQISQEDVELVAEDIKAYNLENTFLLDVMLVYLASGAKSEKAKELISEFTVLFESKPEDIEHLIAVAQAVAKQDWKNYLGCAEILSNMQWIGFNYMPEKPNMTGVNSRREAKEYGYQGIVLHNFSFDESDRFELKQCYLIDCDIYVRAVCELMLFQNCVLKDCNIFIDAVVVSPYIYFGEGLKIENSKCLGCTVHLKSENSKRRASFINTNTDSVQYQLD